MKTLQDAFFQSCSKTSTILHQRILSVSDHSVVDEKKEDFLSSETAEYSPQIRWPDLIAQLFIHGGALYGIYLMFTAAQWRTVLWGESHTRSYDRIFYTLFMNFLRKNMVTQ